MRWISKTKIPTKKDFYNSKWLFKIEDIDINKILVSKIEPYGKKCSEQYIIGYNDDDVITYNASSNDWLC